MKNHLRHSLIVIAFSLLSPHAMAASCSAPEFTAVSFNTEKSGTGTISTSVAGMLKISLPADIQGIALSGDATVFGYRNNDRIVIGLESPAAIAPHATNIRPETFYRDIFMGKTPLGCKYLQEYSLAQQDFRIRSKAGTMDILAYGKDRIHEVIVLHPGRQDTVIRMRFSGYDRLSLESILSTIVPH